jgi:hypothetical protein
VCASRTSELTDDSYTTLRRGDQATSLLEQTLQPSGVGVGRSQRCTRANQREKIGSAGLLGPSPYRLSDVIDSAQELESGYEEVPTGLDVKVHQVPGVGVVTGPGQAVVLVEGQY